MLQDIPNPFPPVVARSRRPSHPESDAGHRTIPVRVPPDRGEAEGAPASRERRDEEPFTGRIIAGPGPGEVAPPRWWTTPGRGS
jgi:hypothetical protein